MDTANRTPMLFTSERNVMKANAKLFSRLLLGVTLGLAALTQVAHAADFNPQPDPPGKSARAKGLHNPPGDKVQQNLPAVQGQGKALADPPGEKGALVDPNDKGAKGALVDPNDKGAKGALVDPNDKGAKGAVIGPNDKKK
jgi:hypothetical protein